MDFHFLVMEKSWKINIEKDGYPGDALLLVILYLLLVIS